MFLFTILTLLVVIALVIGGVYALVFLFKNGDKSVNFLQNLVSGNGFRFVLIGILCLLSIIPLQFVNGIVYERSSNYREVINNISNAWGENQALSGPYLVVPYSYVYEVSEAYEIIEDGKNKTRYRQVEKVGYNKAIFLPDDLQIEATLDPTYRYRGIYQSLVYGADFTLTSRFSAPDFDGLATPKEIFWDQSYASLSISDTRAISETATATWNGAAHAFYPGTDIDHLGKGIHVNLPHITGKEEAHDIQMHVSLNGSGGVQFSPLGKQSTINVSAPWGSPSFQGSILPDERTITDDHFSAVWSIPYLSRSFPQRFLMSNNAPLHQAKNFQVGVNLFEPVQLYNKVLRAVKYGMLFIGLTFFAFFLFECSIKLRLHYVQYVLIACALSVFYLMILSFSEHIPFSTAYLVSAGAILLMLGGYTYAATRRIKPVLIILMVLSGLYAVLYSLLHMQDYALLLGTILLLATLVIAMFVTRNMHNAAAEEA